MWCQMLYLIRMKGRQGRIQIDAESDFALKIEIKDEKSNKAKTVNGKDKELEDICIQVEQGLI